MDDNWPGLMRRTLLGMMPAEELGKKLHGSFGRPSKELYSMAGLIFLMETFNWTRQEPADHYTYDTRVHYALNLPPNRQYVCVRTLQGYLKQFRESEFAQRVFEEVTAALIETLKLKVEKQRLDSTHVYSNMARMGRTWLTARVVRNLLDALDKRFPQTLEMLDPSLRARYAQSDGQLFGMGRRGKAAVYISIVLKTAGYNMLQAVRALRKRKTRPIGTNPAQPALHTAPFSPQYVHFRLIQHILASQFRQSSACVGNTPLARLAA